MTTTEYNDDVDVDYSDPWDDDPHITIGQIADGIDPREAQLAVARIMRTVGATADRDSDVLAEVIEHVIDLVPGTLCNQQDEYVFYTPAIDDPEELGDFYPIPFWSRVAD